MADLFASTKSKILAKRAVQATKAGLEKKERVEHAAVINRGAVNIGGHTYRANIPGGVAGMQIDVANRGTGTKAIYHASASSVASGAAGFGSGRGGLGGLSDRDVRGIIDDWINDPANRDEIRDIIEDYNNDNPPATPPPSPTEENPETRTVQDIIRDTVGPVSGSGSTVTVRIPDTVEVGDFLVFVLNSYIETAEDNPDWLADLSFYPVGIKTSVLSGGWSFLYGGTAAVYFSETPYPADFNFIASQSVWKEAELSDINSNKTFTLRSTMNEFVYYLLVFKGDYIVPTDSVDWNNGEHDIDGWTYEPDETSNLVIGTVVLYENYSFCLVHSCAVGNISVTPQGSWTELVDFPSSQISSFVMMKKFSTQAETGWIRGYMTDPNAYYTSVGIGIEQVDV